MVIPERPGDPDLLEVALGMPMIPGEELRITLPNQLNNGMGPTQVKAYDFNGIEIPPAYFSWSFTPGSSSGVVTVLGDTLKQPSDNYPRRVTAASFEIPGLDQAASYVKSGVDGVVDVFEEGGRVIEQQLVEVAEWGEDAVNDVAKALAPIGDLAGEYFLGAIDQLRAENDEVMRLSTVKAVGTTKTFSGSSNFGDDQSNWLYTIDPINSIVNHYSPFPVNIPLVPTFDLLDLPAHSSHDKDAKEVEIELMSGSSYVRAHAFAWVGQAFQATGGGFQLARIRVGGDLAGTVSALGGAYAEVRVALDLIDCSVPPNGVEYPSVTIYQKRAGGAMLESESTTFDTHTMAPPRNLYAELVSGHRYLVRLRIQGISGATFLTDIGSASFDFGDKIIPDGDDDGASYSSIEVSFPGAPEPDYEVDWAEGFEAYSLGSCPSEASGWTCQSPYRPDDGTNTVTLEVSPGAASAGVQSLKVAGPKQDHYGGLATGPEVPILETEPYTIGFSFRYADDGESDTHGVHWFRLAKFGPVDLIVDYPTHPGSNDKAQRARKLRYVTASGGYSEIGDEEFASYCPPGEWCDFRIEVFPDQAFYEVFEGGILRGRARTPRETGYRGFTFVEVGGDAPEVEDYIYEAYYDEIYVTQTVRQSVAQRPIDPSPNRDLADTRVTSFAAAYRGNGVFVATAIAEDATYDTIVYTFTAEGDGFTETVGPQLENTARFDLATVGPVTFTVEVDDNLLCDEAAPEATAQVVVALVPSVSHSGATALSLLIAASGLLLLSRCSRPR
jgi:hypothetical protein